MVRDATAQSTPSAINVLVSHWKLARVEKQRLSVGPDYD